MTGSGHRVDVHATTAPTGERLRIVRDVETGAQTIVDTATGRPWTAPDRRAACDTGVAGSRQLRPAGAADQWWTDGLAMLRQL